MSMNFYIMRNYFKMIRLFSYDVDNSKILFYVFIQI